MKCLIFETCIIDEYFWLTFHHCAIFKLNLIYRDQNKLH